MPKTKFLSCDAHSATTGAVRCQDQGVLAGHPSRAPLPSCHDGSSDFWSGTGGSLVGAGGAALAAVGAAFLAAYLAGRAERGRERRRQASMMTWWVTRAADQRDLTPRRYPASREDNDGGQHSEDLAEILLHIANGSANALYACVVRVDGARAEHRVTHWVGTVPPGEHVFRGDRMLIPSSSTESRSIAGLANNEPYSYVEFADSNRAVWRRFADGRLEAQRKEPEGPRSYTV